MTDIPEVIPPSAVIERRPAAGPHRWIYALGSPDDTIVVLDASKLLETARSRDVRRSGHLMLGEAPTTAAGDRIYAFCPVCGEPVTEVSTYTWDPPVVEVGPLMTRSMSPTIGSVFAPCHHAANRYGWALSIDKPRGPTDAAT